MSAAGNLDIRLPIGGLFTVLGLLLAGYGLATGGRRGALRDLARGQHQPLVGAGDAGLRSAAAGGGLARAAERLGPSRRGDC